MSDTDRTCPLFVTLRVPDQSIIQHVIGLHAGTDQGVETVGITDPCRNESHPIVIDLGNVTEKQWEALEIAHSLGHYSGSRGGNLEQIAEELSISKSAVSQRLRAAEARIVESILGSGRLACGDLSGESLSTEHGTD